MGLLTAHKGYEYQDLLSAFHIIKIMLSYDNATFKIDQKETNNDKFDDLTIITDKLIMKRQIKYSDNKVLEKADLSSKRCDLALDTLFKSWKGLNKDRDIDIRLCLAWEFLEDSQELDFLTEVDMRNDYDNADVKILKINLDRIWPVGSKPISSWSRLRRESSNINRDEFKQFISDLTIEVNLPKASLDFENPELLEGLVMHNLRLFGVGKYPNDKKSVVDVARHLIYLIKGGRARGETLDLTKVIYDLRLRKSYGNIPQEFKMDKSINVINQEKYNEFKEFLFDKNKVCLLGEPGSGKSWFIQNFIEFLKNDKINVVQHYCYTGVDDSNDQKRITLDIFLANLINDIMESFPYLSEYKTSKYGVDFEELRCLINHIEEDAVLIVDGLDHINRIQKFHQIENKESNSEIIKAISKLEFPSNVKVVLASQPIAEVLKLCEESFSEYRLASWSIEEVETFMNYNNLSNVRLEHKCSLSELLLEKSSGNPLYLTYLVNELTHYSAVLIQRDLIEAFPPYNNNLENYYAYLMSRIRESYNVPQILAGAPFPLTEDELKDITHLGRYVSKSIEIMRSILVYNSCTGGYVIYHESFRRYILNLLEEDEVGIEHVIYSPLIEWLERRGFYKDRKSYLNLMTLLFEAKRYDEILKYCNKEFVIDSVYYGHNIFSLKNNFEFLMKAASKAKDYGAVILCTELNNMIYSLEYSFEENSQYYYLGLGKINGFEKLKDILFYDGEPTLNCSEGLKVCYLCSQNSVIPPWEQYIQLLIDEKKSRRNRNKDYSEELEEYKYFICACLDMDRNMLEVIEKISGDSADDYRNVVITEYSRRGIFDELQGLIRQIPNQKNWIRSMREFLGYRAINVQDIDTMFESLKESESYSDDTLQSLNYYFYNIDWLISNHSEKLSNFIASIENKNWYYNWLIFIYKISSVTSGGESKSVNEMEFIEAYSWLIKDMDPFNGKPRTCDLYRYESIIYESIKKPLKYVTTESMWKDILDIIEKMSRNTMTSLMGSPTGPLAPNKLVDLCLDIINESNDKVILNLLAKRIDYESSHRFYSDLAEYSLKYAVGLAKADRIDEAKIEFKKGVEYLLSYSCHKDRTLSHLIDSVDSICHVDKDIGLQCILKLKPLVDAVIEHTDRKDTKYYSYEWFEVLVRQNRDIALVHLSNELMKYNNYWILEDSFDYLLEAMNSEFDPVIENTLFKTRPGNISPCFIKSYLNNIEALIRNEEIELAKQSMRELISRFPNGISSDSYDRIEELCELLELSLEIKIEPKSARDVNHRKSASNSARYGKKVRNTAFEEMSKEEVLEYIIDYGIKESDVQGLFYYIQSIQELNEESKFFIDNLIKYIYDIGNVDEDCKLLLMIIDNLIMHSTVMAYIYMSMFMNHKNRWYRRLTKIEYFIKAVEFDKEIAEQYFFDYCYNNFYTVDYSYSIGGEIINALAAIKYDGTKIIHYWESLFEIINFRLSGQEHYNKDKVIELSNKLTSEESLMLLLLARLKYGEANRYKWIISGMDKMFQKSKYRFCFLKIFKYYLEHYEPLMFMDYSLIMLFWLIVKHFSKEELNETNFINEILKIYPTGHGVIDYLIRKITGEKKYRVYEKYNNDIHNDEELNTYLSMLKRVDYRLEILENRGVNSAEILRNYAKEFSDKNKAQIMNNLLYNKTYQVFIPNVYCYDLLTKHMSNEVEKFINQYVDTPFLDFIEEKLYEVVIDDIDGIISVCDSISPRPANLKLPAEISDSTEAVNSDEEWVRLGYYERWYNKRERYKGNWIENSNSILVISNIEFEGMKEAIPLIRSDLSIDDDCYLTFKTNAWLYLREDVLNELGLTLINRGDGIIGIDRNGEDVLRYFRWEVYLDDTDGCIPSLIGAELKIRASAFEAMENLFKANPKRTTFKIT